MKQIVEHLDIHYATVSRAVKGARARDAGRMIARPAPEVPSTWAGLPFSEETTCRDVLPQAIFAAACPPGIAGHINATPND